VSIIAHQPPSFSEIDHDDVVEEWCQGVPADAPLWRHAIWQRAHAARLLYKSRPSECSERYSSDRKRVREAREQREAERDEEDEIARQKWYEEDRKEQEAATAAEEAHNEKKVVVVAEVAH
jgi:hypothetical protein